MPKDVVNRDDAVIIATFPQRFQAEVVAGLLDAEGIETLILADDAGGAYPMLQFVRGVRLLVPVEDEARAREILAAPKDLNWEEDQNGGDDQP